MTYAGGLDMATSQVAGLSSAAAGAAGGLLPAPQTMDVNALTGSLDAYQSILGGQVASLTQVAIQAASSASAAGGDVTR